MEKDGFYDNSSLNLSIDYTEEKTEKIFNEVVKNNYPHVCPICYFIPIIDADFQNDVYNIICDNKHTNQYNSFKSFEENTNKNIKNLLCQNCKNISNNSMELCECSNCFLCYCKDCKITHEKELSHLNFIEIKNINNSINNIKFSTKFKTFSEIDFKFQKITEKIKKYENFKNELIDYFNSLQNKINNFFEMFDKFFLTFKKIIYHSMNNFDLYQNNFNTYLNYEIFCQNEINISHHLKKVYEIINKEDLENEKISAFIKFLYKYDDKKIFSLNYKEIKEEILTNNLLKENPTFCSIKKRKINELKKMKLMNNPKIETNIEENSKLKVKETASEVSSETEEEIKSFSALDSEKYLILGTKNGEIIIYEIPQICNYKMNKELFKLKLRFRVFESEIKYICEIDKDLISVSDSKDTIKIIKFYEQISKYSIIQTICHEEFDSNLIYSMISLPLLSSINKKYYFCIAKKNNILIYKSNKPSKKEDKFNNENINGDENLNFILYKNIELNTLTRCLIEADERYLVASCPKKKTINFFDMTNDFKIVTEIKNISSTEGSNIFAIIPNKKILVVACKEGFIYIYIDKRLKMKEIHCRYSVFTIEIYENILICSCMDRKIKKIKQYKINEYNHEIKKMSERIQNNNEIWKLKLINNRLFFLNHQNMINYFI